VKKQFGTGDYSTRLNKHDITHAIEHLHHQLQRAVAAAAQLGRQA